LAAADRFARGMPPFRFVEDFLFVRSELGAALGALKDFLRALPVEWGIGREKRGGGKRQDKEEGTRFHEG
jgi:hypothetical protein